MRIDNGALRLSATDLANFLNCRHRTALDLSAARGRRTRPHWNDPVLDALILRGLEHERRFVDSLASGGKRVVDLSEADIAAEAAAATRDAMRDGADVIVQAALHDDAWFGRPDVLLKVDVPSTLGDWSYEPADTKLARETKGGTILQLGLYCDLLDRLQRRLPDCFHIVAPRADDGRESTDSVPFQVHTFRVRDYAAYFRLIRDRCTHVAGEDDVEMAARNYPEPVDHCDVCPWSRTCREKRRNDDHLSLVAGISRLQRRELEAADVRTVTALAALPVPLTFKPARGAVETYERVREQARVQVATRARHAPAFEIIEPIAVGRGLCRLPKPSRGDLFLDIEGDQFPGGGREYLFGLVSLDAGGHPIYHARWADTRADERRVFDEIVSTIMQAWADDAEMHVYHFAPYEPAALKRLMGRHASHEQDIDRLLRAERFVDLYAVVRQGLRVGVERYSIKELEPCYGFTRRVPLLDASRSLRTMERALALECPGIATPDVREIVRGYNEDDCLSTLRLREWLEERRRAVEATGTPVPRPAPKEGTPPETVDEREQRVAALRSALLQGVPEVAAERSTEQHARWLLAYLLDWHRREERSGWWEYYRLRDLPEEDLFDEPDAVTGLQHVERVGFVIGKTGKPTRSVVDRYRYPPQEMEIRRGDLKLQSETVWGRVVHSDRAQRTLDVRKGPAQAETHATSAFAHTYVSTVSLENALCQIADDVLNGKPCALARGLLEASAPRLRSGAFASRPGESAVARALRVVHDLDAGVLAIQGPPGAGKTFTGAEMICELVANGKRVGVTANSHAVIRTLLDAVAEAATRRELPVRMAHKCDEAEDGGHQVVQVIEKNEEAAQLLATRQVDVVGGTAWLWADPQLARAVDVLFVDEAGQMALANVLAVTPACDSLVLLGDPQQLEQPKKGSHPDGVEVSALQHLLGPHQTIPEERGIFLPVTWRLSPDICAFTSELFYEGKLMPKPGLERQRLTGTSLFEGSGLWVVDVDHDGNTNASDDEVDAVMWIVRTLLGSGSQWIDERGVMRPMSAEDVLVVAPFNAHVGRLAERLGPLGVRAGTVDKFQGRESPVAIYSMATSRPEDAPHGLDFLYSLNRLNVATSRARCAAILVASPRLFEPDCRTPHQMKLANALCRFRELATSLSAPR